MSDQPMRSHRAMAIAIVIAGVLISASVFVAVSGAGKTVTSTTTVTSLDSPLSTSTAGAGLELLLSLNASQLSPGQEVDINMSLINTLSSPKNVTADQGTPTGLPQVSLGPCGDLNEPFGFLIAQGFYTAANASSATPMALYSPGLYNCPAILDYSYFVFQPDSYLMSSCESGGFCNQAPATSSSAYGGSWTSSGGSQSTFASFKQGVYTVISATEWGQVAVLHFTVASA
ncbi:MAG: hypothetical protein OK449_02000 [Thaumarchaeota archaeon]|nr:hypothetical protein [Nitrososphaerota archaeon]